MWKTGQTSLLPCLSIIAALLKFLLVFFFYCFENKFVCNAQ